MKIRPKFPKWLPFAVLGGLVLIVAFFAAMSWFRPDNADANARSSEPSLSNSALEAPIAARPMGSVAPTPPPTTTPQNRGGAAGFASQFAQAAAVQRPSTFDRGAAEKALAVGFAKAAGCHNKGDPVGSATTTISIAPSGQILSVTVDQPFAGTFTADCIRSKLMETKVQPFQGAPARLVHSISIR